MTQHSNDWWWDTIWPNLQRQLHVAAVFAATMTAVVGTRRFVSRALGEGILNRTLFGERPTSSRFLDTIEARLGKEGTRGRARRTRPRRPAA